MFRDNYRKRLDTLVLQIPEKVLRPPSSQLQIQSQNVFGAVGIHSHCMPLSFCRLLDLNGGVFGITADMAVYPFAYHAAWPERHPGCEVELVESMLFFVGYDSSLHFDMLDAFFMNWRTFYSASTIWWVRVRCECMIIGVLWLFTSYILLGDPWSGSCTVPTNDRF